MLLANAAATAGVGVGDRRWAEVVANPAVTAARTLSDTFAGIEPASAPMFVAMQFVGAALAVATVRFLYPRTGS